MRETVKLEHPEHGGTKELKKGWSWTCFFFYFTGIPLLNRGLFLHGAAMLALWASMLVASRWTVHEYCGVDPCTITTGGDLIALMMVPLGIFYALKANKMGLDALQSQGWIIKQESES